MGRTLKLSQFLLAFIIYAPTLVIIPQIAVYVLISIIGLVYLFQDLKTRVIEKNDLLLFLIFLISLPIFFLGEDYKTDFVSKSVNDYIPYLFFLITTVFFAKRVNPETLKIILIFIVIESIVGIIEFLIGKPYLISPGLSRGENSFGETNFLYYDRVYGLSTVVSVFAQKVFTGILLVYFLKIKKYKIPLILTLLFAVLVSFNRTAIVAIVIFYGILFLISLKKLNSKKILLISLGLTILIFLVYQYFNVILYQFNRGQGDVDLSGREMVFPEFFKFISNHLIYGNYCHKLWIFINGAIYHAHNSYLQTFANNGIFLGSLIFVYLFKLLNKNNIRFLFPILMYSTFQYGILWGVSYLDILFFSFIYISRNRYLNDSNL